MQFSTDSSISSMNVTEEADKAYCLEKKILLRVDVNRWLIEKCIRCEGPIYNAPFLGKEGGHFCTQACRDNKPKETTSSENLKRMRKRIRMAQRGRKSQKTGL